MSLREYPDYRDSGVDWLGQVPTDWTVQPLRNVTDFTTGWTPPTGNADSYDGDFLWANISDLGPKHLSGTAKNLSAAAIAASNIPLSPKGSLLFSFKLTIGSVSIVGADMYTNEAIATFHASEFLSVEYAYYALPICVVRNASENIYGAPMLNARLIRSARIAIPPIVQQRQIADYLDAHTAKIDMLIGKQEQLIETLAERRQAVISHAVTKGLDPNIPMRDSGVAWLGKVPASWVVVPVKWFCRLTTGMTPSTDSVENYSDDPGDYPWVRPENLLETGAATRASKFVSVQGWNSARIVPPGASLLCCIGATVGKVGITEQQCNTNQQITALKSSGNDRYFFYSLLASKPELVASAVGNTLPILNSERLGNVALPVPPPSEQSAIAMHLDREAAQIDALSAKAREMIDVLKERRQALISAAVTGKIDVRGLA